MTRQAMKVSGISPLLLVLAAAIGCGNSGEAGKGTERPPVVAEAEAAGATRDPAEAAKDPVAKDYFPLAVPAPDFELTAVDDQKVRLADLRGKVVLIDFWATWCGPCKAEIPHLKEMSAEYGDDGLVVLGVSLDQGGFRVLTPFVERSGINYPVVLGGQKVASDYGGIQSIPTKFLIDRDGLVRKRYVGMQPVELLVKDLKVLL